MRERDSFLVTLKIPFEISVTEMEQFIEDAIMAWGIHKNPEYPIYDLNSNPISVRHLHVSLPKKEKPSLEDTIKDLSKRNGIY